MLSITGSVLLMAAAILLLHHTGKKEILVVQMAGWPAPFGITLVADMLSALMIGITAFIGLMNTLSFQYVGRGHENLGFYSFYHFLIMGVNGAFLAGDIFNLYVWFEVMLIASFALLVLGNERKQLVGAVKYMLLSFIASSSLLIGIGMVYGLSGSLNMADLAVFFQENADDPMITVAAVFFLFPFALKAAMFPIYFWLPDSYPTPPISVGALFAGLLTKVGVYAMLRLFTLVFVQDVDYTHGILLAAAGLTMLSGVLGAVSMNSMRKILSFHIISQIGYMVMGLALFTPLALAGSVFYIIHHIIVKTNLFLITGIVEKIKGSSDLAIAGGMYKKFPVLSLLFLIPAFSLAGLPPLSGFWAKFILIKAGFEIHSYFIVGVAILTGLLTLYSMVKIWNNVFWAKASQGTAAETFSSEWLFFSKHAPLLILPVFLMAAFTIFIGLYSAPLMEFAVIAAEQMMQPSTYIEAVLSQ